MKKCTEAAPTCEHGRFECPLKFSEAEFARYIELVGSGAIVPTPCIEAMRMELIAEKIHEERQKKERLANAYRA